MLGDLMGQLVVHCQHSPQADERAHDGDIGIGGAIAVQCGREHRDSVFGEHPRSSSAAAAAALCVPLYLVIEASGRHAVKRRQLSIEHDALSADHIDLCGNPFDGDDAAGLRPGRSANLPWRSPCSQSGPAELERNTGL